MFCGHSHCDGSNLSRIAKTQPLTTALAMAAIGTFCLWGHVVGWTAIQIENGILSCVDVYGPRLIATSFLGLDWLHGC